MASLLHFLFLFSFFRLLNTISLSQLLPVSKDPSTLQYLTKISHGTPLVPTQMVVDLGGPLLWIDCSSRLLTSSSLRLIPFRSIQCLKAKTHEKESKDFLSRPRIPTDQDPPCEVSPENSITGKRVLGGQLAEDKIAIQSEEGIIKTSQSFLFSCASSTMLLNGLASGAEGMIGLSRAPISFPSQISIALGTPRRFTICLSSSNGFISFYGLPLDSHYGSEILRSLTYTPLVTNQGNNYLSQDYFIKVNSVKINGKFLSLNHNEEEGIGVTKLSSVVPYTTLESSIYANFTKAYVKAAISMNMSVIEPVAPFGACFSKKGIESSVAGPNVPSIDFVLQSEMVKWRINGRNTMVEVSDEVMCLGFLDGGLRQSNPIVIGGYQLEDVLVQIDLDTSTLGFSTSLLMRQTTCSHFKFNDMPMESL